MRARHHLLAGAAVLLLAMPAAALAQAEYSQYPPIPGLIDEVKAGTLSQADYDKLVAIRDQGAERISDSAVRASARSTANSETVKTVMGNINAEITESVKNGDAEAVVDASLNGGHAMTTQVTMPGIANAGVVIDDMVDVMRKVYQARAQMAGANPDAIAKELHKLDLCQAAIDAGLYVVRKKMEAGDTAAQNLSPAARAAVVAKTDAALKNGAIKVDAKGKLQISPVLLQAAGFTEIKGLPGGNGGNTSGKGVASSNPYGNRAAEPLTNATRGSTNNSKPVTPGGAPPGYDGYHSGNANGSAGYDTGTIDRPVIIDDKTGKDGFRWTTDGKGNYFPNPDYDPRLDPHSPSYRDPQGLDGMGGGGGSSGGGGTGSGGGSGGYPDVAENGYGSVALDSIYGTTQVIYGNGWSNVAPIPSTQVAGPSSVLNSPDTHPQGPSSAGLTGPSSGGVTGPSSAGLTGPSSGGLVGPSSAMTGPSSAMTGPSTQVTGPSSAMTSPETQLNGPSDALGNPDALSDVGNDDQPSLCGR